MVFKNKNGLYVPKHYMGCMGIEDQFNTRSPLVSSVRKGVITPVGAGGTGGSAGSASYDPATDATIVHWFKSDWTGACLDAGAAQCDDGEECATWVASKGNNAAYQSSVGPLFQTNYQNSKGALEGVSGSENAWMASTAMAQITQPFTFWVAGKCTDLAHACYFIDGNSATATDRTRLQTNSDGYLVANAGTAILLYEIGNTNWHIWRVTFNGASSTYQVDGGSSTAFPATPGTNAFVGITLFDLYGSGAWSGLAMGEVLIQTGIPASDATIRSYLNTRWAAY